MKHYSLIRNRDAVAGVIEALLLVALVATVISTIQLIYIPQVMEQREAEHMDYISNQFSHLKAMIDIQIITGSNTPIFSMITLGSRELPYFITARASGEIEIVQSSDYRIMIDDVTKVADLTSITYDAYNSYFIDQIYSLEGGGIIVDQPDGESVMRVRPPITVSDGPPIKIHFELPVYQGLPGKNQTYGQGKCVIRTNYSHSESSTLHTVGNYFRIYTQFPNAWNETLGDLLEDKAIVTQGDNYVQVTEDGVGIDVEIRKIYVSAQIGPGWVI